MAIAAEKFDLLVKKLEKFSKGNPQGYHLRVGLFAALGYGYIFLILAGLLALISAIVLFIIASHRANVYIVKLIIVLLVPTFAIARALWVKFPAPQGLKLTRELVPQLFNLVDELTNQLQAPKFHQILLIQDFNAAVSQVPRLGIFGWQQNYLLLGLPLMQSLSVDQLKAVLAHELGHLSGNHSRFAGWIYRVRKIWRQIYERLHQSDSSGASFLFNRFLEWYLPSFNAYSFVLARMNEYQADRCARELAGAESTAEALVSVELKSRLLENHFWSDIQKKVIKIPDPPDNAYSLMSEVLQRPLNLEESREWLEQALAKSTDNEDTHPCLADRLKSLGYPLDSVQKLVDSPIDISAAETLLGKALPQLVTLFNRDWQQSVSTPWRQQFAYFQEVQTKLNTLEDKAKNQNLEAKEAWERAYYTLELRGKEVATPLLKEALEIDPNLPNANYTLGQILLAGGDDAGIACIEKAIAQRIDWVIDGCQLIYSFLTQQNRLEEAQSYRQQAETHAGLLLKARQERQQLSYSDRLSPHTLPASEVKALKQQLSGYRQIKQAYIVEKVLRYFPEERLCVIGIVRQGSFLESGDKAQKLVNLLVENLDISMQAFVIVLNSGEFNKLKPKIAKVEHSLVFKR